MRKHLYLLALQRGNLGSLYLFYAADEQEAEQQATRIQAEDEQRHGTPSQRVELRPCPYGFTAGIHTYYPPTQEG
jgi:hypothetical protein